MFAIFHRALTDSFLAFDTAWKPIGIAVLGAIVTALLVLVSRGWTQFKEHVIANIFIVFGGALATWLLVFVWIWIHVPGKIQAESKSNLDRVIEEKKQLSIALNAKTAEISRIQHEPGLAQAAHVPSAKESKKECWMSSFPTEPNPGIKGAVIGTEVILHCNYKIDAPLIVEVEFDTDFIPGIITVVDAGITIGGVEKQGNIFVGRINSPAVLSNQLVIVRVYGDTKVFPRAKRGSIKSLS